jgi:DNA ligase (NAD+)
MEEEHKRKTGKFSGKRFVLTGSLEGFSRNEAQDIIKSLGGGVSLSVNKKTDFVVVGKDPGSKYDKARKLSIKIISESEFKKMISEKEV